MIINNTIFNNDGDAFDLCWGIIVNCIVWENQFGPLNRNATPAYSCIQNWSGGGIGNISDHPQFAMHIYNPSSTNVQNPDQLKLLSHSPCRNTGGTEFLLDFFQVDFNGRCRLGESDVDMGCFELSAYNDSDGDLIGDPFELAHDYNPHNPDSDGDGLIDGRELLRGTNPLAADAPAGLAVPGDVDDPQRALFLALPGETITVAPGTWPGPFVFPGHDVILQSAAPLDPATVAATIFDGGGKYSVATLNASHTAKTSLNGFTITNGSNPYGSGVNGRRSRATITHNVIHNNQTQFTTVNDSGSGWLFVTGLLSQGGGLYECDGLIAMNQITNNKAYIGAGLRTCNGVVQSNAIAWNLGVGVYGCSLVRSNLIRGNQGVGTLANRININNTIVENSGSPYGGSVGGYLINNIFWNNSSSPGWGGNDTFVINQMPGTPLFVDAANGDFRLLPDSPGINAGIRSYYDATYNVDLDGKARIAGAAPDFGCYELGAGPDTDGDLLADADEATHGANPLLFDTNGNGLPDGIEVLRGASPAAGPGSGLNVPGDTASVQDALFLSYPGDTITVGVGTYNESLISLGRPVTLQGSNLLDEATVAATIINANGVGNALALRGWEDDQFIVQGISLLNGRYGLWGAGAAPRIERCLIKGNTTAGLIRVNGIIAHNIIRENRQGLVSCANASILNNQITHNSHSNKTTFNSTYGIGLNQCSGIIKGNVISHNILEAEDINGAGLYLCSGVIEQNIISHNELRYFDVLNVPSAPPYGEGAGLYHCSGTIQNNLIFTNVIKSGGVTTGSGGGLYRCFGVIRHNVIYGNESQDIPGADLADISPDFMNNIVWGNLDATGLPAAEQVRAYGPNKDSVFRYSCIQNFATTGTMILTSDPLFVDAANGDFRLQAGSPCIDAGAAAPGLHEDFDGAFRPQDASAEPRGDGSDYDIGAFEFAGTITPTPTATPTDTPAPTPTPSPTPSPTAIPWPGPEIHVPAEMPTIQAAIDAALHGDEIIVAPGTYFENIRFGGKNVRLRSTDPLDPDIVAATIIDGQNQGNVVTFDGIESPLCEIKGFTVTHGRASHGAIMGNLTLATVANNVITSNSIPFAGIGGTVSLCNGLISHNTITHNDAPSGGVFRCGGATLCNTITHNLGRGVSIFSGTLRGNVITHNTLTGVRAFGGFVFPGAEPRIENNLIAYNSSISRAGGMDVSRSLVINNTIAFNSAANSEGGIWVNAASTLQNNIVWGNMAPVKPQMNDGISTPTYSLIEGWAGPAEFNNISGDPLFADAAGGDFGLLPQSPAIDAGDPAAAFNDACFPPALGGPRNDIGWTGGPMNCPCGGAAETIDLVGHILRRAPIPPELQPYLDANGDGALDVADLLMHHGAW